MGKAVWLRRIGVVYSPESHRCHGIQTGSSVDESVRFSEHYRGSVGEAWEWIDKNTEENHVAYTGTNKSYPLYRKDISNRVTYIDTGPRAGELPLEDRQYYDAWICMILSADMDYLSVCKMDSSTCMETNMLHPIEKKWADTHPELFQSTFSNDYVTIYKVSKSLIPSLEFPSNDVNQ